LRRPIHLVADPDRDARAILELALRHGGYDPVCVPDGESALEVVRQRPVAAVITELYLPAGGERCLLRALRGDSSLPSLPVVVHTAYVSEADRRWAQDGRCEAFLAKPASVLDVLAVIASLAGGPRAE
jgi:CheY-like chemotaxis protein